MKRRSPERHLRLITEISVTPLLDLVFVLLLIFMITAPLLKNESSLLLPVSSTTVREAPPKRAITLAVDEAQSVMLDGHPLARAELSGALAKIAAESPDTAVMVQIHRDLPVQSLVEIMDELNSAGVKKTSVVATKAAPR
jgi:biopolymer transport protein TolR